MYLVAITFKSLQDHERYNHICDYWLFDTDEEAMECVISYQLEDGKYSIIDSWHIAKIVNSNDESLLNKPMGLQD